MSDIKAKLDGKISGKKVFVVSKSYCPFCVMAKTVFQDYLASGTLSTEDYEVMEIENDPNCDEIQDYMKDLTGGRSVPRVFINGKCIGGGSETKQMKSDGQLDALITA